MEISAQDLPETGEASAGPRPGSILRGTREHLGLTVGDVARHLRLSPRQVEAIEADEYHRLPGGPFVRGFVRNYARLLQIDAGPLLDSLHGYPPVAERSELEPESQEIPFPTTQKKSWSRTAALGVLLLMAAGLLVFEGYREYVPRLGEVVTAPPAEPVQQPAPEPVLTARPAPSPAPAPVIEVVPQPDTTGQGAALAAAEASPAPPVPAMPTLGRIRLEFQGDSWVEVRDRSGKPIFSQLNGSGSIKTVEGNPPLSAVIGNASLVRLYYNGEPVDLAPHTKVEVARITLQ